MTNNNKLNILILFGGDFPFRGAYANRILAFAKGFQENGNIINILIIFPGRHSNINSKIYQEYEGIRCKITHNCNSFPDKLFKKIFVSISSMYSLLKEIKSLNIDSKIDCIISCSDNILMMFPIFIWCRINKVIFLREYNEFPRAELGIIKKFPIITNLFYKTKFNMFDGMILISYSLRKFFSKLLNKHKRIIIIPIIVEPERFNCLYTSNNQKNIVFIGDILGDKDGVPILIDAFSIIADKIIDQDLLLIGDLSNNENRLQMLKDKIKKNHLEKRIHFIGFIPREKVSNYLCYARILVLARPDNKQSQAGFPTKLGEYLATGNPVVCTKVGDIPNYLHDGENAYLVEPNNIESLAEKLLTAYNNPKKAKLIGESGKKLVIKEFNYKYQCNRLAEFITTFNKT